MTNEQLIQAINKLPDDEKYIRYYRAFEGDYRIVSEDYSGSEHRYRVIQNENGTINIQQF